MKKMHSVLTLILCLLLLGHLFLSSLLITHTITMTPLLRGVSHSLMLVLVIHILLTFIPMLLNHDGNREKPYTILNKKCYLQRISGVLIALFLHPHFFTFVKPTATTSGSIASLPYYICLVLFIILCCLHISVSIPKALLGLGIIVDQKVYSTIEKISFTSVFAVGLFAIISATSLAIQSNLFGVLI